MIAGSSDSSTRRDHWASVTSTRVPVSNGSPPSRSSGRNSVGPLQEGPAVDVQGPLGHGRVHDHRDRGDGTGPHEGAQVVEHHLGPVHGERRNHDLPAPLHGAADQVPQPFDHTLVVVVAVPVGGLHQQHVGVAGRLRRRQQRVVGPTQVAGHHQGPAAGQGQVGRRGTQDVPGPTESEEDPAGQFHRRPVGDGHELAQHPERVRLGEQRQGRRVLGVPVPVGVRPRPPPGGDRRRGARCRPGPRCGGWRTRAR